MKVITHINKLIRPEKPKEMVFPQGKPNPSPPKPIPKPVVKTPQRASVSVRTQYTGDLEDWLLALRKCESDGNYQRNSGNGYYGAYQFLISTWNRVAPKVGRPELVGIRPDKAKPADQDYMVIHNARISAGLVSQHPGCYRKLGLSNKPPVK